MSVSAEERWSEVQRTGREDFLPKIYGSTARKRNKGQCNLDYYRRQRGGPPPNRLWQVSGV